MEFYMNVAIKLAKKALRKNEVPIGAVIVKNGKIIAKAYNKKEKNKDSTMHAEILAIKKASKKIKDWRLLNCELYVTMEPCMMCSGAIEQARISKLVYAIDNPKFGYSKKIKNVKIVSGICKEESQKIVKEFFQKKRRKPLINLK